MINYSVFMMLNQLMKDGKEKAYAKAQVKEVMTFQKFVQHIADHNGVYSRGTVKGVISDMCECLVEQLLEGKKVQLGELGNFWVSLSCEGADSIDKFTQDKIKAVNIIFTPGNDFENLIGKAEFNLVSSRIAQAATLKAEKTGASTVDLAEAKKNTGTTKPSTPSKDSGSTTTPGKDETGGNAGKDDTGDSKGDTGDSSSKGDDSHVSL